MTPVITEIGVKMRKNSFASYVLLVLCVEAAVAQFVGGPQQNVSVTTLLYLFSFRWYMQQINFKDLECINHKSLDLMISDID